MPFSLRSSAFLLASFLGACSTSEATLASPDGGVVPPADGRASAYRLTGRVVDASGKALANVEVVADNQALYDSNVLGVSNTDGAYRIELPEVSTSWAVTATHVVDYHGKTYHFDLDPSATAPFAGSEGAVRDFTWKLSGTRRGGGTLGGYVAAYTEPGDIAIESTDVELTLEPDGPLVDGSAGAKIVRKLVRTPDGDAVTDVPVGRYRIAARLPTGPLEIRRRAQGEAPGAYASTVTADFEPEGGLPIFDIQVEVRVPG